MTTNDFIIYFFIGMMIASVAIVLCEHYGRISIAKKWRNFKCKHNKHNYINKRNKSTKIHCQNCKKRKPTPHLRLIDGGNKIGQNKFRF